MAEGIPHKAPSVAIICFKPDYGHAQPLLKIADALAEAGFHIKCYLAEECRPLKHRFRFDFEFFDSTRLLDRRKMMTRTFGRGLFFNRFCYYVHYLFYFSRMLDVASCNALRLRSHLREQCPDLIICDPHWVGEWCCRIAASFKVPLIINNLDGSLHYNQRAFVQIYGPIPAPLPVKFAVEAAGAALAKFCRYYFCIRYFHLWCEVRKSKRLAVSTFEAAFPLSPPNLTSVQKIVVGMAPIERTRLSGAIKTHGATWPEFYPVRVRSVLSLTDKLRAWVAEGSPRPIVYVSFGSAVQIDTEFATAMYQGLRRVSARILWSLPAHQHGLLSSIPVAENIRLECFVPQPEILSLPEVRCFVSHAGPSSVQESLFGGTPLLCIPFFADQGYNSAVVEQLGVGKRLHKRKLSAETVQVAVQDILANETYLKAAMELREELLRKEGGAPLACYLAGFVKAQTDPPDRQLKRGLRP